MIPLSEYHYFVIYRHFILFLGRRLFIVDCCCILNQSSFGVKGVLLIHTSLPNYFLDFGSTIAEFSYHHCLLSHVTFELVMDVHML